MRESPRKALPSSLGFAPFAAVERPNAIGAQAKLRALKQHAAEASLAPCLATLHVMLRDNEELACTGPCGLRRRGHELYHQNLLPSRLRFVEIQGAIDAIAHQPARVLQVLRVQFVPDGVKQHYAEVGAHCLINLESQGGHHAGATGRGPSVRARAEAPNYDHRGAPPAGLRMYVVWVGRRCACSAA